MARSSGRFHYGWLVMLVGALVTFGALGLARFGYSVVLKAMCVGLDMDKTQAGAVATVNLGGYLALAMIGGALASHYGPRVVIAAGLVLAGVGMLMTGLANSVAAAALGRLLTGIGSGASNVPVVSLMAAWFAPRRRGMAAGVVVAGSSVALIMIGPMAPKVLTVFGENGWRVCWFIFGTVTLIFAAIAGTLLRNRPSDKGLMPLGARASDPPVAVTESGPNWRTVFRSAVMWKMGLVYMANGFSYIIYMTFFSTALVEDGHYSQGAAGNTFMLMGWFSLFCGVLWGSLSDIIGRRRALIIVYLIHAASFSIFALFPNPAGFTISAVLFGLTAWSIPAIMGAACGDILGPRLAPAGLGFITLLFGIGQASGPSAAGALADAMGSLLPAMLLAGAVALVGAGGATCLPSDHHSNSGH